MVLPATLMSPSSSSVTSTKIQGCKLHSSSRLHTRSHQVSAIYSAKFPRMEQSHEPPKLVVSFNYTKEKLWELIPGSVKDFPWKKAESFAVHETLILGKEILKWTSIAVFSLSFLSDIIYFISRNKELMIPLGLYVGCTVANYFDEISKEFMQDYKDRGSNLQLLGIGCIFILVKVISEYFSGRKFFLLHVANGGVMQVLWKWNNLPKECGDGEYVSISTNDDD